MSSASGSMVFFAALLAVACSSHPAASDGSGLGGNVSAPVCTAPSGPCDTVVCQQPLGPGLHVAECSVIDFATNPPSSGPHYPRWANFQSYTAAVPRGYYVHSLEHGAVVLAYHCPNGCASDVAALDAIVAGATPDPACAAPVVSRLVLTPDPHLAAPIAAAAWGFTLEASCVDTAAVSAFVAAHYAHAPEDECAAGFDPTAPASGVPVGCGEP